MNIGSHCLAQGVGAWTRTGTDALEFVPGKVGPRKNATININSEQLHDELVNTNNTRIRMQIAFCESWKHRQISNHPDIGAIRFSPALPGDLLLNALTPDYVCM